MDYDLYALDSRGVVARADIIGYHGGKNPSVEVEFTTATGERVRGETSNFRDLDISTLAVVYDPRNPNRMQAADYGYPYWLPSLLVAGGIFFAVLTVRTWRYGIPKWLGRTP